jgi:hypothetical protein
MDGWTHSGATKLCSLPPLVFLVDVTGSIPDCGVLGLFPVEGVDTVFLRCILSLLALHNLLSRPPIRFGPREMGFSVCGRRESSSHFFGMDVPGPFALSLDSETPISRVFSVLVGMSGGLGRRITQPPLVASSMCEFIPDSATE